MEPLSLYKKILLRAGKNRTELVKKRTNQKPTVLHGVSVYPVARSDSQTREEVRQTRYRSCDRLNHSGTRRPTSINRGARHVSELRRLSNLMTFLALLF